MRKLRIDTTKYLASTRLLTTEEHGALLLLITQAHWHGFNGIPNNDRMMAGFAGVSVRRWKRICGPVLDVLRFDEVEGVWKYDHLATGARR